MLAQNFKSAAELDLDEDQVAALQKTLVMLETGKLTHVTDGFRIYIVNSWQETGCDPRFDGFFNLATWAGDGPCGSVCCIGGTAEAISGVRFNGWVDRPTSRLHDLFAPHDVDCARWAGITPSQAATALRSYLTTGDARWDLAVA